MARNSLQDQLLKAGLVNEKKLKQANREKRNEPKQAKGSQPVDEQRAQAERALAERAERDRELARQQREEKQQREIAAQIRQMIEQSRQPRGGDDTGYNFADGKQIKKLFVSRAVWEQLSNGQLGIVKLDDKYELVPRKFAEKIAERDPARVLVLNSSKKQVVAEEDPYAAYQIPDDLMW